MISIANPAGHASCTKVTPCTPQKYTAVSISPACQKTQNDTFLRRPRSSLRPNGDFFLKDPVSSSTFLALCHLRYDWRWSSVSKRLEKTHAISHDDRLGLSITMTEGSGAWSTVRRKGSRDAWLLMFLGSGDVCLFFSTFVWGFASLVRMDDRRRLSKSDGIFGWKRMGVLFMLARCSRELQCRILVSRNYCDQFIVSRLQVFIKSI